MYLSTSTLLDGLDPNPALDWHQCGNSLALCYFAELVMEMPDSLWMTCKSEFGVSDLRYSPRRR